MGDLSNGSKLKLSAILAVNILFRLSNYPGFASGYLPVFIYQKAFHRRAVTENVITMTLSLLP
ncbi:hypothetical protein ambt_21315 [Alteromonas naphthalenivorans]|uniref:Uncharacterized protein n=1 Tax=Alteromonas naphthalenivorans TaxID=715451 RepID=F5ZFY6_ALTNA|nr:hypothetical protein ambt_21315 [Alteromonas naphthalenivorans]